MGKTFFEKYPKYQDYSKNFLGAWTFADGDEILTIKDIDMVDMYDKNTCTVSRKVCLFFEEKKLPMVFETKKNQIAAAQALGTDEWSKWIGKKIKVGETMEKNKKTGKVEPCIRIRPEKVTDNDSRPASEAQKTRIQALIAEGVINEPALCKFLKISDLSALTQADALNVIRAKTGEVIE